MAYMCYIYALMHVRYQGNNNSMVHWIDERHFSVYLSME